MQSYLVLCAIFIALGLLRRHGVVPAILLLACFPFSNSHADYFYYFGIYAYDTYFLSLGLASFAAGFPRFRREPGMALLLLFVLLVLAYALVAVMRLTPVDKYFLRDLRPVIWALCTVCVLRASDHFGNALGRPARLLRLAMVFPAGALAWQAASFLGYISFEDFYYEQNSYRMFTLGTYFCSVFLVGAIFIASRHDLYRQVRRQAGKEFVLLAALCFLVVVVCGFRMPLLAVAAAAAVLLTRNLRAGIAGGLMGIAGAFAIVQVAQFSGADRVVEALSVDGLVRQFSVRFEPALAVTGAMTPMEHFLGSGFGTTFNVWWFGSRGLDTTTNFIDSTYLTLHAKYGFAGLGLWLLFASGVAAILPGRLRLAMVAMLLTFGIAYAVPYQSMFPGLLLGITFVAALLARLAPPPAIPLTSRQASP